MSTARPTRKTATTPKRRRWPWVVGSCVVITVLLALSLAFHKSVSIKTGSPDFGPTTAAPSGPSPGQPTPTTTSGPALAPVQMAQMDTTVKDFISAAFSLSYNDPPNAPASRVKPYITSDFTGTLPTMMSPSSNGGQDFIQAKTKSIAQVDSDTDIVINGAGPTSLLVTVTFTQTTSYDDAPTHWETFQRTLTLTKVAGVWLVSHLSDGADGP